MALRCIVTTVSSSRALLGLSMTCILACSGCFNDEFSDARTEPIWDDRELIERIGSYELESIDATLIVEEIEGMLSMRLKSNESVTMLDFNARPSIHHRWSASWSPSLNSLWFSSADTGTALMRMRDLREYDVMSLASTTKAQRS